MKTHTEISTQRTIKRLGIWAVVVSAILMIPMLTKAPWTGSDFVFGGVVLFGCASAYEFATKNITNPTKRMAIAAIVFTILIGIWALAVAD